MNKPFAKRAWNQTSAKACSLQLLNLDTGKEPTTSRPDRLVNIDRRNLGTVLHDTARLCLHALLERGKWPNIEKTLMRVLTKGGGRDVQGEPLSFLKNGHGYPMLMAKAGEIVPKAQMFIDRFEFNADNRIGSEHFVAVDANGDTCSYWNVPEGGYHGRIDWAELSSSKDPVPNQLKVIDFKNYPSIMPRAELRSHEQLSFYAWMLAKHHPESRESPVLIGIYYFEYGVTSIECLSWDEIDANVERLFSLIRFKQNLKMEDVRAEPGFGRCQYCEYLSECPEGVKLTEGKIGAIVDLESAKAAANALFVTKELVDATTKGLREWCKEHGPVRISDTTGYAFTESPEIEYEALKLVKNLVDAGIDKQEAKKVLRVDKIELSKLVKKHERVEKLVESMKMVTGHTSTFKAFKPTTKNVRMTKKVTAPKKKATAVTKKAKVRVTPRKKTTS